jgi:hypothetical protein
MEKCTYTVCMNMEMISTVFVTAFIHRLRQSQCLIFAFGVQVEMLLASAVPTATKVATFLAVLLFWLIHSQPG